MIPVLHTYLTRPIPPPTGRDIELDMSKIIEPISLTFVVERSEYPMFATDKTSMYRYCCQSCRYASGEFDLVFRTSPASAEKMKDGPTEDQQEQMSDHSRQHEIMWRWVKGMEKR